MPEMERSDSINELAAALAKARGVIKNPPLDKENPHFKSKYATLAACRDAVEAAFTSNGLSLVQSPVTRDGEAGVDWMLTHSSGQWLSGACLLPVDKKNAQGVGSSLTYSRRYVLMSVAGIIGDDDDDGNAAAGAAPKATVTPTPKKTSTKPASGGDSTVTGTTDERLKQKIREAGGDTFTKADTIIAYVMREHAAAKTWNSAKIANPGQAVTFEPFLDLELKQHGPKLLAVAQEWRTKSASGAS